MFKSINYQKVENREGRVGHELHLVFDDKSKYSVFKLTCESFATSFKKGTIKYIGTPKDNKEDELIVVVGCIKDAIPEILEVLFNLELEVEEVDKKMEDEFLDRLLKVLRDNDEE